MITTMSKPYHQKYGARVIKTWLRFIFVNTILQQPSLFRQKTNNDGSALTCEVFGCYEYTWWTTCFMKDHIDSRRCGHHPNTNKVVLEIIILDNLTLAYAYIRITLNSKNGSMETQITVCTWVSLCAWHIVVLYGSCIVALIPWAVSQIMNQRRQ